MTAIEHGGSVYTGCWTGHGASAAPWTTRARHPAADALPQPSCNEWRFEPVRRVTQRSGLVTLDARLRYHKSIDTWDGDRVVPWYPVQYELSDGHRPGRLHLSHLEENHFDRCWCEYDYALLGAEGPELAMMGRQVPDDVIAYDPAEAERWFLTRDACETARAQAVEAIRQDGSETTRVGFHVNGI